MIDHAWLASSHVAPSFADTIFAFTLGVYVGVFFGVLIAIGATICNGFGVDTLLQ